MSDHLSALQRKIHRVVEETDELQKRYTWLQGRSRYHEYSGFIIGAKRGRRRRPMRTHANAANASPVPSSFVTKLTQ